MELFVRSMKKNKKTALYRKDTGFLTDKMQNRYLAFY